MPDIERSHPASRSSGSPIAAPPRAVAPVALTQLSLSLAWNVRGDPANADLVATAERVLSLPLPLQPNSSARRASDAIAALPNVLDDVLLGIGPTTWLYLGRDAMRECFDAARKAMNAADGALFDVSASYVAWCVSGTEAAHRLSRRCPLDLHSRAFPAGHCAQSLLGHVNALLWRPGEEQAFVVLVARSFAAGAWEDLQAICGTARAVPTGRPISPGT